MSKFMDSLSYAGGLLIGGSAFLLIVGFGVGVGYDLYKSKVRK